MKRKYPENNLRKFRLALGLTLEQAAERVEPQTNHDMIAKLENGERELTHTWMLRLAPVLHCAPEDLISEPASPSQRAHLEKYQGLNENERAMFDHMLDSYLREKASSKETVAKKPDPTSKSKKNPPINFNVRPQP